MAHAQQSPEQVSEAYFQAMQSEGLLATSRFMHPSALAEFKSMVMPVYDAEHASGGRQLLDLTFSPDVDYEALQTMDPMEFLNGFMGVVTAQNGNMPLQFDDLQILGTIEEGEARHVLTRITVGAGDLALSQIEVLSFLPYEDTWLLQLNMDLKGLATAMRANLRQ
jgi:hypothetical protein